MYPPFLSMNRKISFDLDPAERTRVQSSPSGEEHAMALVRGLMRCLDDRAVLDQMSEVNPDEAERMRIQIEYYVRWLGRSLTGKRVVLEEKAK